MGESGSSIVIAAIILGLSIVGGSYLLKDAIDGGATRLAAVAAQAEADAAKLAAAPSPAGRPEPSRPRRPDPEKRYTVDVGEAATAGPDSAKVKIVEWSDFQCPFCRRVGPTLEQVKREYGDEVQIAFKHMPLSIHPKALPAHAAAEAAARQGKFWEMHDRIFANQRDLEEETFVGYARELGLDVEQFKRDMKSADTQKKIQGDIAQANTLGVTGTPAFFINGRFLSGAQPFASFKRVIDEELAAN